MPPTHFNPTRTTRDRTVPYLESQSHTKNFNMSGRLTIPKIFMAGGAVGFTYYMVMRPYWFPNPYKTRESQNIEDRWTAGGGTPYSTPAAGTKRGMWHGTCTHYEHTG